MRGDDRSHGQDIRPQHACYCRRRIKSLPRQVAAKSTPAISQRGYICGVIVPDGISTSGIARDRLPDPVKCVARAAVPASSERPSGDHQLMPCRPLRRTVAEQKQAQCGGQAAERLSIFQHPGQVLLPWLGGSGRNPAVRGSRSRCPRCNTPGT